MNVLARLEFQFANYDPAVQCFNHYTMKTPPIISGNCHILPKWLLHIFVAFFLCSQHNFICNNPVSCCTNSFKTEWLFADLGSKLWKSLVSSSRYKRKRNKSIFKKYQQIFFYLKSILSGCGGVWHLATKAWILIPYYHNCGQQMKFLRSLYQIISQLYCLCSPYEKPQGMMEGWQ